MSSLPFALEGKAVAAIDAALAAMRLQSNASSLSTHKETQYIPSAPFPSLNYDKFLAAVRASPAHKPAVQLAAKAKQAPARQKVAMYARQSKVVALVALLRQSLSSIESRRAATQDRDGLYRLFTSDEVFGALSDHAVVDVKGMFVALEAPPGTGKSVQLPIMLANVESLKKTRIISVTCFGSDGGSRAVASHAAAAKIRSFSLETEQFVSAATYGSCDVVTDVTRIVVATAEIFTALLVTAVAHQHRLLAALMTGSADVGSYHDPLGDVGAIAFDFLSEACIQNDPLVGSMLSLLRTYYSLRVLTSVVSSSNGGSVGVSFAVPQCLFACDSTASVGLLEAAFYSTDASYFAFRLTKEVIASPNPVLFEGGVMASQASLLSEGIATIITRDVLEGSVPPPASLLTILSGQLPTTAWAFAQSSDATALTDVIATVPFRTYQNESQVVFSAGGGVGAAQWFVQEAVRRRMAAGGRPMRILVVLPDKASCVAVASSVTAAHADGTIAVISLAHMSDVPQSSAKDLASAMEAGLDVAEGHCVIVAPASALPAISVMLPSRYSAKMKECEVFSSVISFVPATECPSALRLCCVSASAFSPKSQPCAAFVDASFVMAGCPVEASGGVCLTRALDAVARTVAIEAYSVAATAAGGFSPRVVRRIVAPWSSVDVALAQQNIIRLTDVDSLAGHSEGVIREKGACVEDPVSRSQCLIGLTTVGLYCITYALTHKESSTANASSFTPGLETLYRTILGAEADADMKAVVNAAAAFPQTSACDVISGQIGALIASPTVTVMEKVVPVRCRGWAPPITSAWRESQLARSSGVIPREQPAPRPIRAIVPTGAHPEARHQIHQQAIMRIYQRYKVRASEDDAYSVEGPRNAVTPEEGFSTVLAPLITGAEGTEGCESRVALSLRPVTIGLGPVLSYNLLSSHVRGAASDSPRIPSVSSMIASHLIKVRDLVRAAAEQYLTEGHLPRQDVASHIRVLLQATQEGDERGGAVRSQRVRRGAATAARSSSASNAMVSTSKVAPFTPLLEYTTSVLTSDLVQRAAQHSGRGCAPLIAAAVMLSSIPKGVDGEGSDRPYHVFRRSLAEAYAYARAHGGSGLASLWCAAPSLYLAQAPVDSARRAARRQQRDADPTQSVGAKALVNDGTTAMPFTIARRAVARREELLLTVQQYTEEVQRIAVAGRRYESVHAYRTRRGEWLSTSPLRTLLVHRFMLMASDFSVVQRDDAAEALALVMDSDNTTAMASLVESQLKVWTSVFFPGNDEDMASFGVRPVHTDAPTVGDDEPSMNAAMCMARERRLMPVQLGHGLGPREWAQLWSEDSLLFGRTSQQEASDVTAFKRFFSPTVEDSTAMTKSPHSYVAQLVSKYVSSNPVLSVLRGLVADRVSEGAASVHTQVALYDDLCQAGAAGDADEIAALLTSLRLFWSSQQMISAAYAGLRSALMVDATALPEAFLHGAALRERCMRVVSVGGVPLEAIITLPDSGLSCEAAGAMDDRLHSALLQMTSLDEALEDVPVASQPSPGGAIPTPLHLLAVAMRLFSVGNLRLVESTEARNRSYFNSIPDLFGALSRIAATNSAAVQVDASPQVAAVGVGVSPAQPVFRGEEPPPSLKSTIIRVARHIVDCCGSNHHERRRMEQTLSKDHAFLTEPSSYVGGGPAPEGSEFYAYYLYQIRLAAPGMLWLGDADDVELSNFLADIESEVIAEREEAALHAGSAPIAAEPQAKRHRPEDDAALLDMLRRAGGTAGADGQGDDFCLEEAPVEQVSSTADGVLGDPKAMPDGLNQMEFQQPQQSTPAYAGLPTGGEQFYNNTQQTYPPPMHPDAFHQHQHEQAQFGNWQPQQVGFSQQLPMGGGFSALLDDHAGFAAGHASRVEASPIFDVPHPMEIEAHPLSTAPPPIPVDPTGERRYSVIVFPVPDVDLYLERQVRETGEAPHINLPNSLAMALGATLDRTVGPTFLLGNVARIDVPSRGLEQRAVLQGSFMCLGTRLKIIPNTRILDNPALAHERSRGRGRGGRGRGGADGGYMYDNNDGRGRGAYRGRGINRGGGVVGEPALPSYSSGGLLPVPLQSTSAAVAMMNDTYGIAEDSD